MSETDNHRLADAVAAPQWARDNARRGVGAEVLSRIEELPGTARHTDDFPVRLSAATTVHDLDWLLPCVWAALANVVDFADSVDLSDNRTIGGLGSRARQWADELETIAHLGAMLGRFQDSPDAGTGGPISTARQALSLVLEGAVAALGVGVAESGEAARLQYQAYDDRLQKALDLLEACEVMRGTLEPAEAEDILKVAFGASPGPAAKDIGGLIRAYSSLDPLGDENYVPSPFFPGEAGPLMNPGDRLVAFAERQLRFCGVPSDLSPLDTLAYFGRACWIARQHHPVLAHLSAMTTAELTLRATLRNEEAVRARLALFQDEDAHRVIQVAARATDAAYDVGADTASSLGAYKALAEGVVRPWLRLLLDISDLAHGKVVNRPPTSMFGTLVEQAEARPDEVFTHVLRPLDTELRNAIAHETGAIALDGRFRFTNNAGEPIAMDEAFIGGIFGALRSAFAGVDVAVQAFVAPLLSVETGQIPEVTLATLEQIMQMHPIVVDEPDVTEMTICTDVLVIDTLGPWSEAQALETGQMLLKLGAGKLSAVEFRSQGQAFSVQPETS